MSEKNKSILITMILVAIVSTIVFQLGVYQERQKIYPRAIQAVAGYPVRFTSLTLIPLELNYKAEITCIGEEYYLELAPEFEEYYQKFEVDFAQVYDEDYIRSWEKQYGDEIRRYYAPDLRAVLFMEEVSRRINITDYEANCRIKAYLPFYYKYTDGAGLIKQGNDSYLFYQRIECVNYADLEQEYRPWTCRGAGTDYLDTYAIENGIYEFFENQIIKTP